VNRANILIGTITVLFLSGCTVVGPEYIPPETGAPSGWHSNLSGGLADEAADPRILAQWWTSFNDPLLSRLADRAIAGNLDIKEARSRVREARARRGISAADTFPSLDASGSVTKRRSGDTESKMYAVGFDAGWELDIFGGVQRDIEAAQANLEATQEKLRDVLVSLLAEVGLNYIEARTYQIRVSVAEANRDAQQETYELNRSRYQAGLSDELAMQQARYNLENTLSQIPSLRAGLDAAMNRLAVMLGEHPGAVHAEFENPCDLPDVPSGIAVGIPADMLRRRPDVRQAERSLAAQTAKVGVAVADLYPKFSLTGSVGLESLSSGSLFSSESRNSSLGPRISWPVFSGGAIRQNIEIQSALQEQSLIQYESAVLRAVEEVENALVSYSEEQNRRKSLKNAAEAAGQAVALAENKYAAGLTDFSNVLDSQRTLLSLQDQLAVSQGKVITNLITLYKALGGGWDPDAK
jgi:NodT family efflux transporter outer membrane factor (OMF) lipoprotein